MNLQLLRVKEASNTRITEPKAVFEMMQEEAKADRECMWVLHLNSRKEVIEKELISMGTINSAISTPREVFRKAVIQGSQAIILVHNHPSGNTLPSDADRIIERSLKAAGKILGIHLLDFIIIGQDYYSFKESEK